MIFFGHILWHVSQFFFIFLLSQSPVLDCLIEYYVSPKIIRLFYQFFIPNTFQIKIINSDAEFQRGP